MIRILAIAGLIAAAAATAAAQDAYTTESRAARAGAVTPAVPRVPAEQLPGQMRLARGSLLRATLGGAPGELGVTAAQVSPFAVPEPEPKVLRKHDLVTIIVREESRSKTEGTADMSRESSYDAQLKEWISLNPSNWAIQGGAQGDNPPSISLETEREFKGDAAIDRTDMLTFRIAAAVLDVKPNGTVVLQARKHIRNDDEDQLVTITGICRVEDLTADNTVLSSQLHDLEVIRRHEGAVRDATRRGWLLRLLDAVTPL